MADGLYVPARADSSSLFCSVCGYGIARPVPPERCPMCQKSDTWVRSHRRPFGLPALPDAPLTATT